MIDNRQDRFGSAGVASIPQINHAGLFRQNRDSLFVGFIGNRPLWYSGAGGLLLTAGARAGKLRDVLAYNICAGIYTPTMLILDMKGELAAISRDQTADGKFCIYWMPIPLHGFQSHRVNPVDYIRADSATLVSDVKVFCENMIPVSNPNSAYFEGRAQEFFEALILTLVKLNGVLTLRDLYRVINLIVSGGEEWLDFAYDMSINSEISKRIEEEIAQSREDSTGGFRGILGELFKAFSCLSDPALLESVSPPFDFSLSDLCSSDQTYNFYMCPPAEFIEAWSQVIKAIFVGAMIYKSRAPSAPRQTWLIDECAQLQKFPLIIKLYTYGAGIGIRPWCVFQSKFQMNALGANAEDIITSSAQLRSFFGIRDFPTARAVSDMIGDETLVYEDTARQLRARQAKQQAVISLMHGGDPVDGALRMRSAKSEMELSAKQQRRLRTPDEILKMGPAKQFIFTDELPKPIYADRLPYFEQRFMDRRFHPNPYHPPEDKVRVKVRFGHRWRRVVNEPVPARFAHFPQYQNGLWSKVK